MQQLYASGPTVGGSCQPHLRETMFPIELLFIIYLVILNGRRSVSKACHKHVFSPSCLATCQRLIDNLLQIAEVNKLFQQFVIILQFNNLLRGRA